MECLQHDASSIANAWDRLVQRVQDALFEGEDLGDGSLGPAWESLEATLD